MTTPKHVSGTIKALQWERKGRLVGWATPETGVTYAIQNFGPAWGDIPVQLTIREADDAKTATSHHTCVEAAVEKAEADHNARILAAIQPDPEPQPVAVACPCTMIEQDESCPVGYPSLLCEDCDGIGILPATPSSAGTVSVEAAARVLIDAVKSLDGIQVHSMTDHQKELFVLDRAALRALTEERG